MKKYIKLTMILLEIESEGMMAGSPGISKDPATGPACAKEYSGSFVWDDDDYSSETTDSNPNVFGE
ncbi:toxin PIN [Prevotella merdae]|uniref:toxin PIN n=1 Tax=Prevotella merdae TaxID=2079531 RepID=UPI003F81ED50